MESGSMVVLLLWIASCLFPEIVCALERSLSGAPVLNLYGVLVLNRQSHHFFIADVRISLNLTGERSLLEKVFKQVSF